AKPSEGPAGLGGLGFALRLLAALRVRLRLGLRFGLRLGLAVGLRVARGRLVAAVRLGVVLLRTQRRVEVRVPAAALEHEPGARDQPLDLARAVLRAGSDRLVAEPLLRLELVLALLARIL